LSSWTSNTVL
jgi:hypothetical protein